MKLQNNVSQLTCSFKGSLLIVSKMFKVYYWSKV